jgi:hypothetical protein
VPLSKSDLRDLWRKSRLDAFGRLKSDYVDTEVNPLYSLLVHLYIL